MRIRYTLPIAATTLMVLLSGCENSAAPESSMTVNPPANSSVATEPDPLSSMALEEVAERMRQTSQELQAGIRENRAQREAMEARHEIERKRETERVRQQAINDASQLAAIRSTKERQAAEAAQAQARQEMAARMARAERERLAALEAQRALEEKASRERATKAQATKTQPAKPQPDKTVNDRRHLGEEPKFGVDI